jgi:hypothetical protein
MHDTDDIHAHPIVYKKYPNPIYDKVCKEADKHKKI